MVEAEMGMKHQETPWISESTSIYLLSTKIHRYKIKDLQIFLNSYSHKCTPSISPFVVTVTGSTINRFSVKMSAYQQP